MNTTLTSVNVNNKVNRLPRGMVFTCQDIAQDFQSFEAVVKSLNRMVQDGRLAKLSKGKFYKPRITVFGSLLPSEDELIKDLIQERGAVTGYVTGLQLFNRLGLTSQVASTIRIARNEVRPKVQRGDLVVSFVRQKNRITKESIPLLEILDAVRAVKQIPDSDMTFLLERYKVLIQECSMVDRVRIVKLAMRYPPSTRALFGALMESMGDADPKVDKQLIRLRESLNPLSTFRIAGVPDLLGTAKNWNLV